MKLRKKLTVNSIGGKAQSLINLKNKGLKVPSFIIFKTKPKNIFLFKLKMFFYFGLNWKNKFYALRSSANVEDSEVNSFAGIFQSLLNISGNEILDHIEKFYQINFSDKVKNYAQTSLIDYSSIQLGLIIQEMIDAASAGVLFSHHPSGNINHTLIQSVKGLGEGLVSDHIEGDTYLFDENNELLEKKIFDLSNESLNPTQLKKIIEMNLKLKKLFLFPYDLEFAFNDTADLYLLQLRPITTFNRSIILVDSSNLMENYPERVSPLTFDTLKLSYQENLICLMKSLKINDKIIESFSPYLKNLILNFDGFVYYSTTAWNSIMGMIPIFGKWLINGFNEIIGSDQSDIKEIKLSLIDVFKILKEIIIKLLGHKKLTRKFQIDVGILKNETAAIISKLSVLNLNDQMNQFNIIQTKFSQIFLLPLFNDVLCGLSTKIIKMVAYLSKTNSVRLLNIFEEINPSSEKMVSHQALILLKKIGKEIKSNYLDQGHIHIIDENLLKKIINNKSSPVHHDLKLYLELYGDRCIREMELLTPSYRENLTDFANLIISEIQFNHKSNPKLQISTDLLFREKIILSIFKPLFIFYQQTLIFREEARLNRVQFKGLIRQFLLTVGQALKNEKRLNDSTDIFFITLDELSNGTWKQPDILKRKLNFQSKKSNPFPVHFLYHQGDPIERYHQLQKNHENKFEKNKVNEENQLTGILCGGNQKVTARVLIVEKNHQSNQDVSDKIIVTRSTDPGWYSLISNCRGLIVERGSLLSHAAILSRELNLTTFIQVKSATEILQNNDLVELDPRTGTITRLFS